MKKSRSDIIYKLNDNPGFAPALLAAIQHLLSIFVGIITPSLIIGSVLGLNAEIPYLISMALIVSGIATFIQAKTIGPIGSGLLSIQGTSFAFLGPIITAGLVIKNQGGDANEILGTLFALCFVGAFIEMFASRFLHFLKKIITPVVTGTVVTLIGLSLIKVAVTDMAGGQVLLDNNPEQFGDLNNLLIAGMTLIIIIILNRSQNPLIRMSSIIFGLIVGYIISYFTIGVDFEAITRLPKISIPIPFKYGFKFNWNVFFPIALVYVITTIESIGDLTATSMVSEEPIKGKKYINRIKAGILGDGFNSMIAAIFNTFPNTTFSQNNGVIQLTGIASRFIGMYVAGLLVLLGMFPVIGGIFQQMPKPVLGGATIIMFGTVASAGIKILASQSINRRSMMIIALSYGLGLGVQLVPEILQLTPNIIQTIFSSPITTGGLTAIICNIILPNEEKTGKS